jgi:hypothetical protein
MTPDQRIEIFQAQLPSLLPKYEGRYALVHGGQVSIYDSPDEANRFGFEKYGKINDFLVIKIEPQQPHNWSGS